MREGRLRFRDRGGSGRRVQGFADRGLGIRV